MKNAIFTCSDAKYGDFLINAWLKSLKANVDLSNTDVVILDYGFSEEQREQLAKENVIVLRCVRDGHVVSLRFRDMAAFLKKHPYDQILSTDGGDIIFQTDLKELFGTDKNEYRAVCEDVHMWFDALIDLFFSREYCEKIKHLVRGKKMINAGVLVAPHEKFLALCEEVNREVKDKATFGPDQICINYILYRDGFVPLDRKYNFVVATCEKPFTIQDGVFYMGKRKKIAIVHNAGGHRVLRPIRNFGYGPGHNELKKNRYLAARTFAKIVHLVRPTH
jgi:hypothetical protein